MENSESKAAPRVTVAGIGPAAGGLDALRTFFQTIPPDLGLGYVVVSHLAPVDMKPADRAALESILGRNNGERLN